MQGVEFMKKQKGINSFLIFISFGLVLFTAGILDAASFTQDEGPISINWSSARFKTFGVANIEEKSTEGIQQAEQRAMEQAYKNVQDNLEGLYSVINKQENRIDFNQLKPSIYLAKTEYYDLNSVKVIVEARMSRLYKNESGFLNSSRRYGVSKNSGIIFLLDSNVKPQPIYSIYDETGKLLFDKSYVYLSAFDYSTMGRWFKGRAQNSSDIDKLVGKNPKVIHLNYKDGKFVTSFKEWQELLNENAGLLADVKIALVLE